MVTKLVLKRNLDILRQDEEDKRNDLSRNRITMKIISRQSDEVLAQNSKLPPKGVL